MSSPLLQQRHCPLLNRLAPLFRECALSASVEMDRRAVTGSPCCAMLVRASAARRGTVARDAKERIGKSTRQCAFIEE